MQNRKSNKSSTLKIVDLDQVLTPLQAAEFLQISPRTLLKNVRLGKVACIRINSRVLRFHTRTLIAGN